MMLSPEQIDRISHKISSSEIYYTDIRAELTDHIACKVEVRMAQGQSFDQALEETCTEINPRQFQRKVLSASHLGMAKQLGSYMVRPMILLKSALLCATYLVIVFLFDDLTPEGSVKQIKTLMLSGFLGMALISFSRDLLKNSALVASANTFWWIFCVGQFALNVDLLVFFGLSPEASLYTITFFLSLLSIAGLTLVTAQYKKLKTA